MKPTQDTRYTLHLTYCTSINTNTLLFCTILYTIHISASPVAFYNIPIALTLTVPLCSGVVLTNYLLQCCWSQIRHANIAYDISILWVIILITELTCD